MKKILSVILTLVLCLLPLSSMAEGTRKTISLSNVKASVNDEAPIEIGAALRLMLDSGENGDRLATVELLSDANIKPVGRISVGSLEGSLIAALEGMSSAYTFSPEDMESLVRGDMNSSGLSAEGFDLKACTEALQMIADSMSEKENKELRGKKNAADWKAMGIDPEAEYPTETVSVLGETMELTHYGEASLSLDIIDQLAKGEGNAEYWEGFRRLFELEENWVNAQMGDQAPVRFEGGNKMDVWADDLLKATKMYWSAHTIVSVADQTTDMPWTAEWNMSENDSRMRVTIDGEPFLGHPSTMVFDMDVHADAEGSGVNVGVQVSEPGEECTLDTKIEVGYEKIGENRAELNVKIASGVDGKEFTVYNIDGMYARPADGRETLNVVETLAMEETELASVTLDYSGTVSGTGEAVQRSGDVVWTETVWIETGHIQTGNYDGGISSRTESTRTECRLDICSEPMPEDAFEDVKALPRVKLTDVVSNAELQEKALSELGTFVMRFAGGVLQIPGVSDLRVQTMNFLVDVYSADSSEMIA